MNSKKININDITISSSTPFYGAVYVENPSINRLDEIGLNIFLMFINFISDETINTYFGEAISPTKDKLKLFKSAMKPFIKKLMKKNKTIHKLFKAAFAPSFAQLEPLTKDDKDDKDDGAINEEFARYFQMEFINFYKLAYPQVVKYFKEIGKLPEDSNSVYVKAVDFDQDKNDLINRVKKKLELKNVQNQYEINQLVPELIDSREFKKIEFGPRELNKQALNNTESSTITKDDIFNEFNNVGKTMNKDEFDKMIKAFDINKTLIDRQKDYSDQIFENRQQSATFFIQKLYDLRDDNNGNDEVVDNYIKLKYNINAAKLINIITKEFVNCPEDILFEKGLDYIQSKEFRDYAIEQRRIKMQEPFIKWCKQNKKPVPNMQRPFNPEYFLYDRKHLKKLYKEYSVLTKPMSETKIDEMTKTYSSIKTKREIKEQKKLEKQMERKQREEGLDKMESKLESEHKTQVELSNLERERINKLNRKQSKKKSSTISIKSLRKQLETETEDLNDPNDPNDPINQEEKHERE